MKVLFVSPFLRVPPDFGPAIRNYHLLNHIAVRHQVILVGYESGHQNGFAAWTQERMTEFVSLGPYPMKSEQSKSLATVWRLMEVVPSWFIRAQPEHQASVIRSVLARHPDTSLVILDTHITAQTALQLQIDIPCIGILHDIVTNQSRRQLDITGLRPYKIIYGMEWVKTRRYERRIIRCFRHIATMSEVEAKWVRSQSPQTNVFVSPNGVDTTFFTPQPKPHHPRNLLLVGNFAYVPNEDAFFYLADQILPLIHNECPEATLTAVGLDPSERMLTRARKDDRIEIKGSVPDVRPYYHTSDVAVIPLRLGSGTKLKVLEAMSMGVPVVTTSVGAEGINADSRRDLVVADEPAAIAAAVLRLLRDPNEANHIARRARVVAKEYDWVKLARDFEQAIVAIATVNGKD
jgi:polysaccharide biosynthesis protein PslH